MLNERELHTDVRELLMSNRPFQYAHLIKFERPSRPDAAGLVSTSAHKYTYLTDASRDVGFDDGSKDHFGNSNGSQTYVANKVLAVSNIQENTEAKANSSSVTLDGNGIGAVISGTVTITAGPSDFWDINFTDGTDLVGRGFREGDKVLLSGLTSGAYNIDTFREDGSVVRVKKIESTPTLGSGNLTMSLASEEIRSILIDKSDPNYASFINREVYIYRAYFENGQLIGASPDAEGRTGPFLLFKGIISGVNFDDDDNGIKVVWSLTSHWGDFAQVKGRVTSDDFHRALDANGLPQPYSAIKPVYAYDKGFIHAETSVNILGTYTVQVEKQNIKTKKGFLGLGAKVKVKKYYVSENRYSPLDFQLQAKSIPLIYGVRNTTGIPIFADTLVNDASTIYVAYVLSEGEIGGIYDIYINGKSLICNNQADFDVRSKQNSENTIDVVCGGRADRGDVLSGTVATTGTPQNYYDSTETRNNYSSPFYYNILTGYYNYTEPTTPATVSYTAGKGVIHGESISLTEPQGITLDVFSGREGQEAAAQLVQIAKTNGFKLQNDFWRGPEVSEYWGPNHRLIDTAYIVAKFKIGEGDETIPDIEYIVRGKSIECYNYDYSYAYDYSYTGESASNFSLGDSVTLHRSDTNTQIDTVEIVDKWSFYRPDGVLEHRFRFNKRPNLGYNSSDVPSITAFYMEKNSLRWHMTTFNHIAHSGIVGDTVDMHVNPAINDGGIAAIPAGSVPTAPTDGTLTNPVYSYPSSPEVIISPVEYTGGNLRTSYTYERIQEL